MYILSKAIPLESDFSAATSDVQYSLPPFRTVSSCIQGMHIYKLTVENLITVAAT